jgi:hypothetical protein
MLYKDFIAETAKKLMAAGFEKVREDVANQPAELQKEEMTELACDCVEAAKVLADTLEEDYKQQPVDGGVKRYAEKETFFDNYVNWSKTV